MVFQKILQLNEVELISVRENHHHITFLPTQKLKGF